MDRYAKWLVIQLGEHGNTRERENLEKRCVERFLVVYLCANKGLMANWSHHNGPRWSY